jgi:energy-converting hydrogenase Eha subunit F
MLSKHTFKQLARSYMMKNNYVMLFAIVAILGLAASHTGEPETNALTAAESAQSETATEAADAIDEAS